jgi:hypothetical protein
VLTLLEASTKLANDALDQFREWIKRNPRPSYRALAGTFDHHSGKLNGAKMLLLYMQSDDVAARDALNKAIDEVESMFIAAAQESDHVA